MLGTFQRKNFGVIKIHETPGHLTILHGNEQGVSGPISAISSRHTARKGMLIIKQAWSNGVMMDYGDDEAKGN